MVFFKKINLLLYCPETGFLINWYSKRPVKFWTLKLILDGIPINDIESSLVKIISFIILALKIVSPEATVITKVDNSEERILRSLTISVENKISFSVRLNSKSHTKESLKSSPKTDNEK